MILGGDGEIPGSADPGADSVHVPRPHGNVQQHPGVYGGRRQRLRRAATRRDAHFPVPERVRAGPCRGPEDAAGRQARHRGHRLAQVVARPHTAATGAAAARAPFEWRRAQGFRFRG